MSSSASASGSAILGGGGGSGGGGGGGGGGGNAAAGGIGGQGSFAAAAPVASIIEPPASFGVVAPGIYRCSSSSITQGLPAAPQRNERKLRTPTHSSTSSSFNGYPMNSTSSNNTFSINSSTTATPTESFLSSLQLKTILLLAPEKKPASLDSWCASHNIQLIHLGLGALADMGESSVEEGSNQSRVERLHPSLSLQKSFETYGSFPDSGILSLERIVKDSLEILLHQSRLPCLICDTSGVNETGVVVGCLRRMQRRSFASIRFEYHAFAGSRSRSSHERFIEMFDPDLISFPAPEKLPPWFALQQLDDANEEASLLTSL